MKKTVSYSKSQLLDDLGRLALMVLASVIMAVNLKSFVQAGDLVPGGFNGLTLLIQRVALRFWGLSVPSPPSTLASTRCPPSSASNSSASGSPCSPAWSSCAPACSPI